MTQPLSAQYLENVIQENNNIKVLEDRSSPGVVASWIIGEVYGQLRLHNMSIEEFPIKHKQLGELINLVENGKLSRLHGKNIIKGMISDPTKSASEMADALGLLQINDDALTVSFCNQVLEENAKIVCS
jgi:aspartyl-tRNA(Asn)/glutamyl-tRNA(Gln) amidotransferase subunit B